MVKGAANASQPLPTIDEHKADIQAAEVAMQDLGQTPFSITDKDPNLDQALARQDTLLIP